MVMDGILIRARIRPALLRVRLTQLLKLPDCIATVFVDCLGISLQNAGTRMPNHLSDEEVRDSCCAETACVRVTQVVQPEIFNSSIFERFCPSLAYVFCRLAWVTEIREDKWRLDPQ
jgi:hypothetical protein